MIKNNSSITKGKLLRKTNDTKLFYFKKLLSSKRTTHK